MATRGLLSRRECLAALTAAGGALWAGGRAAASDVPFELLDTKVITPPNVGYAGWPTLVRQQSGRLVVVWSGRREGHVCPFGTVEWMTSEDGGDHWTWPRTLWDSDLDDRDAGVLETSRGTLLVTTFTSLAYEPILEQAEKDGKWDAARLARWTGARNRLTPEQRKEQLGVWMLRSVDNGVSWSTPYRVPVNSPHGPISLQDGRLLYAGKQFWSSGQKIGVSISHDDGLSWDWQELPVRDGDRVSEYHELHAAEGASGRLIVQIRNHNPANAGETLQCESDDGGKTWTQPHPIGVWGLPSHLLRLRDGRLLMTYGHRRAPLGNQARVSMDEGRSWSAPILLSTDAASGDMGYPSTVELDDGRLVTVWYELLAGNPQSVLRQARWRLST